jgi:phosphate transport system permease protein
MELELNSMQKTIATGTTLAFKDKPLDLRRKSRPVEDFVQRLLFFCGFASIITTLAIVFVLSTESLRFFTNLGWSNTNHELNQAVDQTQTQLKITTGGFVLEADQVLQINEEILHITRIVDSGTIEVERGYLNTAPVSHPEKATLFVGKRASIVEFLTGTKWQPQAAEFGILPLALSTIITSIVAMLVALPIGLGTAVYLSEYATKRLRATLKPILEILAGIPTVVYGYFALTFMTPLLRAIFGANTVDIYNMASAGLVMGIMIIPTVCSMSEDALSAVPNSLREASYGIGATRFETVRKVLLPAALSGIIAAFILGVSRAIGETMIVAIAAGAGPNFTFNPFQGAETMTGHIARISTGDLSFNSIDYNSVFAIGLTLFVMTFLLNVISGYINRRFREVYV